MLRFFKFEKNLKPMRKVILFLIFVLFVSCDGLNFSGDKNICQCEIEITFTELVFSRGVNNSDRIIDDHTQKFNSGQLPCRQWIEQTSNIEFSATRGIITQTFNFNTSSLNDWNLDNSRCRGGYVDE